MSPSKSFRAALAAVFLLFPAALLADDAAPADADSSSEQPPPEPAAEAEAPKKPLRVFQARNRNLEYARQLVERGRYEDALSELETAASLPGNSLRLIAEIHATRAQALLLKEPPNEFAARGLIVEMLHVDPEATMLADAPEKVREVVEQVRAEQVLVLHDRIVVARAKRPMRVRVRLVDPRKEVETVTLHYKANHLTKYSSEPMQRSATGWVGYVRDPSLLAPEGVDDEYLIDYFITAQNNLGDVVDSNGSAEAPITTEISATRSEESGLGGGVDLSAVLELREGPPPEAVAPPPPPVPFYKRWYVLAGGGVVVGGIVAGTVYALTRPDELPPHLGEIQLP